jgi:two-component system, OmpR family, sensor histidine kinase CiaH
MMKPNTMNNSHVNAAVLRLTGWYVGIIMLLSLGFSVALYNIYAVQLRGDLQRQTGLVRQFIIDQDRYLPLRSAQFEESLAHIRGNLVLLNVLMLCVGGVVSYALARRHLRPVAEALEAQTRFTADASHELRTPLTAMQTETEVALRNPGLTKAEATKLLASNLEEVGKLRSLSEGLLKLAQSDGKELQFESVSLEEIAVEAVNRFIPAAQAKQVSIDNDVGPLEVRGDQQNLIELMAILLDNAIKYSPSGSTVTLKAKQHGKLVHLSVSDHGYGIKASDLPHIFERFYRSDQSRSKEKTAGYGLGLSIARHIVEAHQGTIEVRSTPGKGSTFTVKLPNADTSAK